MNMEGIYSYTAVANFCRSLGLGLRTVVHAYREYWRDYNYNLCSRIVKPAVVVVYCRSNSLQDLEALKELATDAGFKLFDVVNIPCQNNDWSRTFTGLEMTVTD